MTEEAAGYAVLAERAQLGKVRRVITGTNGGIAVMDDSGGSSPAQRLGATALAAGHYTGEDEYTVEPTGPAWQVSLAAQIAECKARDLDDAGKCIAGLERKVTALEQLAAIHGKAIEDLQAALAVALSEGAALADRVAAVELGRCACKGAGQ